MIGKRLHVQLYDQPLEIVGAAGRVKQAKLDPDAELKQAAQNPILLSDQIPAPDSAAALMRRICGHRSPPGRIAAALLRQVRQTVNAFDGGAVFDERWMSDAVAQSLAPRRFSLMVRSLQGMALVLSFVESAGVVSYVMGRRTHEIGVRMTLGARPRDIFFAVLREGAVVGALGIVIGMVGAAVLTRLMSGLLFGVNPTDLATTACACWCTPVLAARCWLAIGRRAGRCA